MNLQQAFKAQTSGQSLDVKFRDQIYKRVLFKSLDMNSAGRSTATVMLPTPIGEPDRVGVWDVAEIELLE